MKNKTYDNIRDIVTNKKDIEKIPDDNSKIKHIKTIVGNLSSP